MGPDTVYIGEHVALDVHDAALPGGLGVDLRDRPAQAVVGVGGHEPLVARTALLEVLQEPALGSVALGVRAGEANETAAPVVADADGGDEGLAAHAPATRHLT